ncbi:unnamed protein product [Linum tenue]|uniref:Uncharacterized protein n=1 Tax=Linum tenue TaxID=586396 RepID=A0AAV0LJA5_9ROSI|nr:unnamed protein product [Linum tenue]
MVDRDGKKGRRQQSRISSVTIATGIREQRMNFSIQVFFKISEMLGDFLLYSTLMATKGSF